MHVPKVEGQSRRGVVVHDGAKGLGRCDDGARWLTAADEREEAGSKLKRCGLAVFVSRARVMHNDRGGLYTLLEGLIERKEKK